MSRTLPILILLLVAGCAAPLNPARVDVQTRLSSARPMAVRLSPAAKGHADTFRGAGLPFRNETGKSLAIVFAGTRKEMPELTVVSSKLDSDLSNMGFASDYTYQLTVAMGGREFSATAHYRATGFTGPDVAAKIVTEDAIAQIAEKVRAELVPH